MLIECFLLRYCSSECEFACFCLPWQYRPRLTVAWHVNGDCPPPALAYHDLAITTTLFRGGGQLRHRTASQDQARPRI